MKSKTTTAVIQILAAALGWGVIGVFSRPLSASNLSTVQVTFIRSLITVICMGVLLLVKDRKLFYIKLKDLWMFLGMGLLSIVFFNVCYFTTIEHATLAAASILLYTAPFFVMIMSAIFFKEKITLQKIAALVLAFIGCALVSGFAGGDITAFAIMTGLGAGIGYASYSIFGKVALKKYNTFTVIFYTFAVSSLALLPFARIPDAVSIFTVDHSAVLNSLGLGLISTVMPYICYTGGLRYVDAGKASVLAFAEPMTAAVAGIVIFKEVLRLQNAAGILLIFIAIILLNIPIKKNAN